MSDGSLYRCVACESKITVEQIRGGHCPSCGTDVEFDDQSLSMIIFDDVPPKVWLVYCIQTFFVLILLAIKCIGWFMLPTDDTLVHLFIRIGLLPSLLFVVVSPILATTCYWAYSSMIEPRKKQKFFLMTATTWVVSVFVLVIVFAI